MSCIVETLQRFSVFYKITMSHWLYTTVYSTQYSVYNLTRAGVRGLPKTQLCFSLAINRVWLPKLKLKQKPKRWKRNLYIIAIWWPVCSLHCGFHFASFRFVSFRVVSFRFHFNFYLPSVSTIKFSIIMKGVFIYVFLLCCCGCRRRCCHFIIAIV